MSLFVVDSFALIAFFRNEPGGKAMLSYLESAYDKSITLAICTYNLGEIYYMLCRKESPAKAEEVLYETVHLPIDIYQPDWELTYEAAKLKAAGSLSYADAHAAALSLHLHATLLTGDREFDSLKMIKTFKVKYI